VKHSKLNKYDGVKPRISAQFYHAQHRMKTKEDAAWIRTYLRYDSHCKVATINVFLQSNKDTKALYSAGYMNWLNMQQRRSPSYHDIQHKSAIGEMTLISYIYDSLHLRTAQVRLPGPTKCDVLSSQTGKKKKSQQAVST